MVPNAPSALWKDVKRPVLERKTMHTGRRKVFPLLPASRSANASALRITLRRDADGRCKVKPCIFHLAEVKHLLWSRGAS